MIIQIFNRDWTLENELVQVINNDFSFSNILWSWQTSLSLDIDYKEWDLLGKFIKFFIDERLVFSWQITDEKFNLVWFTTITAYWLYDLFNTFQTRTSIDTYWGQISYITRNASSRYPFFEWNMKIWELGKQDFLNSNSSYVNGTQMIREVINESKWDFFIWADWIVRFDKDISEKVHFLSIWQEARIDWEIVWGSVWRTLKWYVSEARGIETWGNWGDLNTYINNDEQSKVWGRVSRNIWSESGEYSPISLMRATKNLLQNPLQNTSLEVKGDIWKYEVWDFVTIENSIVTIEKVKIVKIDFRREKAVLHLDNFSNIYKNLK